MFSPNHRQHLLVAFRQLDETLAEALRVLGAPPGAPVFQQARSDVDAPARENAARAIAAVRDELRAFMAREDLRPRTPTASATHVARSRLDLALVAAAELGARHLRGYGEISAAEAAELDSLAKRLRERLTAALQMLPEARRQVRHS